MTITTHANRRALHLGSAAMLLVLAACGAESRSDRIPDANQVDAAVAPFDSTPLEDAPRDAAYANTDGAVACTLDEPWELPCAACVEASCCAELNMARSPAGKAWAACTADCPEPAPQTCLDACDASYPGQRANFDAAWACIAGKCSAC
jgi:hypothetical protein